MILETIILMSSIAVMILGPAIILGFLIAAVWKKLKRNPASATQISLGIIALMVLVLAFSIVTILILFQLFSRGT